LGNFITLLQLQGLQIGDWREKMIMNDEQIRKRLKN
jgi:hypothetical protein